MNHVWTWCRVLCVASLALSLAGCPGNGPTAEELCTKMIDCGAEGQPSECLTEMQQMKDVLRYSAWASIGNCMLAKTCAELEEDGALECVFAAMAKGDPNAADGLLAAYCQKMIDCGQAPDMTVQACVDLSKAQAGEYVNAYGIFRDSVLDCIEACAKRQTCETLEDTFDTCMDTCGVSFGGSDGQIGCENGDYDNGVCVCYTGWDGEFCDECAAGYVLDNWGDCVPV